MEKEPAESPEMLVDLPNDAAQLPGLTALFQCRQEPTKNRRKEPMRQENGVRSQVLVICRSRVICKKVAPLSSTMGSTSEN